MWQPTLGGWFDIFSQGTLNRYAGMSHHGNMSHHGKTQVAREKSQMIIGPRGHAPSQKIGDLDFGKEADINAQSVELRWITGSMAWKPAFKTSPQ